MISYYVYSLVCVLSVLALMWLVKFHHQHGGKPLGEPSILSSWIGVMFVGSMGGMITLMPFLWFDQIGHRNCDLKNGYRYKVVPAVRALAPGETWK